jgi:C1A family cysteine protease
MMKHVLNVIKDIFDPRDHAVAPNRKDNVSISFRELVPYWKNQGTAGSCTGHAGTEMLEMLYRRQWSRLGQRVDVNNLRFSPMFLYTMERVLEGTFSIDAGAESRSIFQALAKIGCCLESDDPYNEAEVITMPTPAQIESATQYKIGAYHRILDVDTAKTVLESGYTFTIGIPVFQQIESDEAAATGFLRVPKNSDSPIGGHEMHVIGANDSKEVLGEVGAFEVQNSWGKGWGDHGCAWIPYRYFEATESEWDMWTAHFGKPWKPKKDA